MDINNFCDFGIVSPAPYKALGPSAFQVTIMFLFQLFPTAMYWVGGIAGIPLGPGGGGPCFAPAARDESSFGNGLRGM